MHSWSTCINLFAHLAKMVITMTIMSIPSWVDRLRVLAAVLMQQMMSWSWGWRQDRDHRIQPGRLQQSGVTIKVKFSYLSSCSSAFIAAKDKEIIERISIQFLPEVALYRSMDEWIIVDSFSVLSKTFSTKVSVISLARIVLWWSSLLNVQQELQFGNAVFVKYQTRHQTHCCSCS